MENWEIRSFDYTKLDLGWFSTGTGVELLQLQQDWSHGA